MIRNDLSCRLVPGLETNFLHIVNSECSKLLINLKVVL